MKRYYNNNTKENEYICKYYIGIDCYNTSGTIIGSNKCKRCYRNKIIKCNYNVNFVECDIES